MYCLTENFLYKGPTGINMVKFVAGSSGENFTVEKDTNTHLLTIEFQEGQTYSRLSSVSGFTIIEGKENELLEETSFKLRKEVLNIGDLAKYYFKDGISKFSQIYNTAMKTGVYDFDSMAFVSILNTDVPDLESYVKMVNESGVIYVEITDENHFSLYNYHDIDVARGYIATSGDTSLTDFKYIALSATDICSSFLRHCQEIYPKKTVLSEFSDLTKITLPRNEEGYIKIKCGLPVFSAGEFNTHLFTFDENNAKYGKFGVVCIPGVLYFFSHSLEKYLEFRYDLLFMRNIFAHEKYTITRDGYDDFSAMWVPERDSIDSSFNKGINDPVVNDAGLYVFEVHFNLYSYLLENDLKYPAISALIENWRENNNVTQYFVDENKIVQVDPARTTPPDGDYNADDWEDLSE